jgi:hypothetical protein
LLIKETVADQRDPQIQIGKTADVEGMAKVDAPSEDWLRSTGSGSPPAAIQCVISCLEFSEQMINTFDFLIGFISDRPFK